VARVMGDRGIFARVLERFRGDYRRAAASIRAALAPAKTDYLYFVANTEGGHFFSKTLEEHNRNVVKYRKLLAAERNAARFPATAPTPSSARAHVGP